jgi:DNA-binding CsgD family transcriptional regulator
MSDQDHFGRAVAAVYEAAVAPHKWDDALVAIAEAMGATQTALMKLEDGKLISGRMPLMDPEKLDVYTEIKTYAEKHDAPLPPPDKPIGQVIGADNPKFRALFENCREYKEWWKANDLGIGALFTNLAQGHSKLAQIGLYRPQDAQFSRVERAQFALLCEHLVRALSIHERFRRQSLSGTASQNCDHFGWLLVDREFRIVGDEDEDLEILLNYGLACTSVRGVNEISHHETLRMLIANAFPPDDRAGSCWVTSDLGERIWVDVIPVKEDGDRFADWLDTQEPAVLIQYTIPQRRIALKMRGLAKEFGLTPAERSVAIEIVKGDGRAATAQRLGISESTVRSHLSVIFEKVGVHRQSELIELVAG